MKTRRARFLVSGKPMLWVIPAILIMSSGFGGLLRGSDLTLNNGTILNFQRLSAIRPDGINAICVENGSDRQIWIPYAQVPEEVRTALGLNDQIFEQWAKKGGASDVQFLETFTAKVRLLTFRPGFSDVFKDALEKSNRRLARSETAPTQSPSSVTIPSHIEKIDRRDDSTAVAPHIDVDAVTGEKKKLLAMVSEIREVMRKLAETTDEGKGTPTPDASNTPQPGITTSGIIKTLFILRNKLDSIEERLRGRTDHAK